MTETTRPPFILASGSASRRQMLDAAGLPHAAIASQVDEPAVRRSLEANNGGAVDASRLAVALARAKAEDVSAAHPGAVVVGADQVLALGTRLFEKPRDLDDVRAHLAAFRGRTHTLHAAVAIAVDGQAAWHHVDVAHMTMRAFTPEFVDAYIARAGRAILGSVGAYQLEGLGIQLFERIEGDYFTILGMPLLPLLAELRNRKVIAA